MSATYGSYADFLKQKQELTRELESAILHTLNGMKDEAKGIAWFSSRAEDYTAGVNRQAA